MTILLCNKSFFKNNQPGFALLIAIFVLLIIAAITMMGFHFTKLSQKNIYLSLLEARANLATVSALEIATRSYEREPHKCPAQSLTFTKEMGALQGFHVDVSCDAANTTAETSQIPRGISLKAIATHGSVGESDYISYVSYKWIEKP
ncbi:hypothetical protein CC99x_012165 [Candidatus Berkiella cookevillensis]|uniref:Type 4 fimbrial biogenesis protein PilX N-terminal domain-containing protein n=1 Tax=Candidatus Berkiella cookevillensis TaxID=437022 RepID=A0A0Q9YE03_9GAMM|nr:hypothetical protein [Candidatus Berkiella cookevillensis]MCS5709651.1 hypothetical protein [Candidatus Berkiella cookevillensis]